MYDGKPFPSSGRFGMLHKPEGMAVLPLFGSSMMANAY